MFEMMVQQDAGPVVVILLLFLVMLMFAAVVGLTVFWVMMIIDCAKRKQLTDSERVAWILVLVFLGFLGASIYYFAVKR